MANQIKPYKNSSLSKKEQVSQMFDGISAGYDLLNRVISFGADIAWRKKVLRMVAAKNPQLILDIATGTGDIAIMLTKIPSTQIVGLDISPGMLHVGRKKIQDRQLDNRITMVLGDAENIPYEDNYFDAITVSFGIRNFETLEKGLIEIYRVLKPGGIFIILETSVPEKFPFKQVYQLYAKWLLPLIGKLFSKDKQAYNYLSESAAVFPFGEQLNNILRKSGFTDVTHEPQTFGAATIYSASKAV